MIRRVANEIITAGCNRSRCPLNETLSQDESDHFITLTMVKQTLLTQQLLATEEN